MFSRRGPLSVAVGAGVTAGGLNVGGVTMVLGSFRVGGGAGCDDGTTRGLIRQAVLIVDTGAASCFQFRQTVLQ